MLEQGGHGPRAAGPGPQAGAPCHARAKILKYGAVIGSLTRPVAAGDHIRHNLDSDYTPTYTLEEGHTFNDR